eukprot:scaffold7698_cov109-Cylindrotheca_fusiformis.AAC.1
MKRPSLIDRLDAVCKRAENQRCCDCFDKQPGFASILASTLEEPIAALVCFQCSRVHESLGNDICFILNTRNAEEWTAEDVGALERGGNKIINAIFESKLPWDYPRPDSNANMSSRETSKHVNQSKPLSTKNFGLKAPKGGTSRTSFNSSLQASCSSIEMTSEDEDVGFENAVPNSTRSMLGYGDAMPDQDRQRPRQRRARRRASIGVPTEQQAQLDDPRERPHSSQRNFNIPTRQVSRAKSNESLGYGEAVPDSEAPRQRRPRRRGSVGTPSEPFSQTERDQRGNEPKTSASEPVGRRRPGRRGSVGVSKSLSTGPRASEGRNELDQRSTHSGKSMETETAGRRRPGRRGSVGIQKPKPADGRSDSDQK